MLTSQYTLSFEAPSAAEFSSLRMNVAWGECELKMAKESLDNSLFHVCIRSHGKLSAMGRVVGDGAMFFYIQDVIVDPNHQQQGLGDVIMENIENYLEKAAMKGSTIGLLAAHGKEKFYARFGYIERTGEPLGLGMCKFV